MAKGQRSRAQKTSKGENGAGGKGRPLTHIEKINLGGGLLTGVAKRWKHNA